MLVQFILTFSLPVFIGIASRSDYSSKKTSFRGLRNSASAQLTECARVPALAFLSEHETLYTPGGICGDTVPSAQLYSRAIPSAAKLLPAADSVDFAEPNYRTAYGSYSPATAVCNRLTG